jgi:thioredoxin reductase (NADPH)
MVEALRGLQAGEGFELAVVDVDASAELEARYGERVPVLVAGERELCHFRLDRAALTAYLHELR